MKLLIAGGGTGGHIFPALAVADSFTEQTSKDNVLFVGTKHGLESNLVPSHNYNISFIKIRGVKRTGLMNIILALLELPIAIISSIRIIRSFKADFVLGVGGYASGPVLTAAFLLRKRTAITEQNSVPGITNRIIGKFVDKIFIAHKHNLNYFPNKKILITGNPVSKHFLKNLSKDYYKNSSLVTLSILGGSQGSRIINQTLIKALELIPDAENKFEIIHQTGKLDYDELLSRYKKIPYPSTVKAFFQNMAEIYALSDIIICRAGAMTISELQIAGKAAILIPFAAAADNHQELNTAELLSNNAAILIKEEDLSPELLANEIIDLIKDPQKRSTLANNVKKMAFPEAADIISREIMELSKEKNED